MASGFEALTSLVPTTLSAKPPPHPDHGRQHVDEE
jgi:hypothetical protein